MENVLKPLEPPFAPEIEATLANYPRQDGYLLKLFRVFANGQRFLNKGVPNLLDKQSPLSLRERELVILRVCANNQCEYEWGVHVSVFASFAGLSDKQAMLTTNPELDPDSWSGDDMLLLKVVDELTGHGMLEAETLAAFRSRWSLEEQLEIFALVGTYQTISYVANHSALGVEPFAAKFPS